jgi:hypothetical protein
VLVVLQVEATAFVGRCIGRDTRLHESMSCIAYSALLSTKFEFILYGAAFFML